MVLVVSGRFNVILGSDTPIELPFDEQYYLGITIGVDDEMDPRIALTASPYLLEPHTDVDWIIVNADGSILRQSGNFEVIHGDIGEYTVNNPDLDESMSGYVASSFNSPGFGISPAVITCYANNSAGFQVRVYDLSGTLIDHDFSLVAPLSTVNFAKSPPAGNWGVDNR